MRVRLLTKFEKIQASRMRAIYDVCSKSTRINVITANPHTINVLNN